MLKNAAGIAVVMGSKDVFTKAKRSAVMAAIRSRGNMATELRMVALFPAKDFNRCPVANGVLVCAA